LKLKYDEVLLNVAFHFILRFYIEGPVDVQCTCGVAFCWTCQEEAHRPVACETVRKWILKNSAESENLNWILAGASTCTLLTST